MTFAELKATGFVQSHFNYIHRDSITSPKFVALTEAERTDVLANAMQRMEAELEKLTQRILDKDVKLATWHTFHPDNNGYRKLFALVTGIELPDGSNATREAVAAYIGSEKFVALEAERAAVDAAKEQKRIEEHKARMDSLAARLDDGIGGDELLELARHLNIDVHPRTAGMLRRRVWIIKDGTASVRKGGSVQSAFKVYKEVANALKAVQS
jgi:hypothetical protein